MIPTDDHQNTRLGTPASCVDLICRLRRLTLQATRLQIPYSSCPLRLSHGQPSPVRTAVESVHRSNSQSCLEVEDLSLRGQLIERTMSGANDELRDGQQS